MTVAVTGAGVAGFTSAPRGDGSVTTTFENGGVRFTTPADPNLAGAANFGRNIESVPMTQLQDLEYKFTKTAGGASVAPAVRISVTGATQCSAPDPDCDPAAPFTGVTNLEFEPVYGAPMLNMSGDTVDLLAIQGWYAKGKIKGATQADSATPFGYMQTLGQILANNPNLKVTRIAVEAYSGAPWNSFDGSVDYLQVGFAGSESQRYDFG